MAKSRKLTSGAGWSLEPAAPPAASPPRGAAPPVRPRAAVEKRPGGRVVTRLYGLGGLGAAGIADWLKELKASGGCGGAHGDDWLELQGDRLPALREAARRRGFKI